MGAMSEPVRPIEVIRVDRATQIEGADRVAVEEPLEIRLHGRPFAVVMRTPGADRELAAGFLLSESVIAGPDDLGTIAYCQDAENVLNVTLAGQAGDRLEEVLSSRRQVTMNSSCGLCGRLTIESLTVDRPPVRGTLSIAPAMLVSLPERLRAAQRLFDETGGLHAAGLFAADGQLAAVAEDVGRHNAVDKVVGRMVLAESLPVGDRVLCVSGRTSFEIVQKAYLAGIPIVAAVSAPSSLAVDLARDAGVTLVGFVRGLTFNVYAHPERIV
jgi:FdhD protein